MPAPTKLEIIDRALGYLESNDVTSAIEYLRRAREEVLKERERRRRRSETKNVDPCIRKLMYDENFRNIAREYLEKGATAKT